MVNCVNVVALSGEVAWVKQKYSSSKKIFLSFAIKQPNVTYENGEVVSRSSDFFFCSCFDHTQWLHGRVKEGVKISVQGKLSSYKTSDKKAALSIIVEKLDVHGLAED